MKDFMASFPSVPTCFGEWMAIYLEPMVNSGERITIAIAAKTFEGEYAVHRALTEPQLRCLYGSKADDINSLIAIITNSLSIHLGKSSDMQAWLPPFTGVEFGSIHQAADESLNGILSQGLERCASLSQLIDESDEDLLESQEQQEIARGMQTRWRDSVLTSVKQLNSSLIDSFGSRLNPYKKKNLEVDFSSKKLVAGMVMLPLGQGLADAERAAKIRLHDLLQARHMHRDLVGNDEAQFEIIVQTEDLLGPRATKRTRNRVNSTLQRIRYASSIDEISFFEGNTPTQVARHIVERAA